MVRVGSREPWVVSDRSMGVKWLGKNDYALKMDLDAHLLSDSLCILLVTLRPIRPYKPHLAGECRHLQETRRPFFPCRDVPLHCNGVNLGSKTTGTQ